MTCHPEDLLAAVADDPGDEFLRAVAADRMEEVYQHRVIAPFIPYRPLLPYRLLPLGRGWLFPNAVVRTAHGELLFSYLRIGDPFVERYEQLRGAPYIRRQERLAQVDIGRIVGPVSAVRAFLTECSNAETAIASSFYVSEDGKTRWYRLRSLILYQIGVQVEAEDLLITADPIHGSCLGLDEPTIFRDLNIGEYSLRTTQFEISHVFRPADRLAWP